MQQRGAEDEVESIWQLFQKFAKGFPLEEYEVIDTVIRMFVDPVLQADIPMLGKLWTDERDAKIMGKRERQSWLLKKGELICIPHGVHQSDEHYFRDPQRFDTAFARLFPGRFFPGRFELPQASAELVTLGLCIRR